MGCYSGSRMPSRLKGFFGAGYAFPYGDYFVLDLEPADHVHIAWGEGPSYAGPGNLLYSHN